jgi:cystathionine beta-synthase
MMNDRIIAKRLHEETKGSVYINQYFNQLNIDAHYKSTGPEIWKQTNGNITFSCL